MISNNFPYYQPNTSIPQFTPQMLQAGQQAQPQMQPQIQSPFVTVRSEAEARNYPVAYGNSVTFKDETAPYVYSKTMGFSQLDKPIFEKYRLIKEESEEKEEKKEIKDTKYDSIKEELDNLKSQINTLWDEMDSLKEKKKKTKDKED